MQNVNFDSEVHDNFCIDLLFTELVVHNSIYVQNFIVTILASVWMFWKALGSATFAELLASFSANVTLSSSLY